MPVFIQSECAHARNPGAKRVGTILTLILSLALTGGGGGACSDTRPRNNPGDGSVNPDGAADANLQPDGTLTSDGSLNDGQMEVDGAAETDAAGFPDSGVVPTDPLEDRLSVVTVATPEGVKGGASNWRIWGMGNLHVAPVFTVPLANCETLVGFTTSGGGGLTPRVARLSPADTLVETHDLTAGLELRGLAAEPNGHFGALLWDDSADEIYVTRYDPQGNEVWTEELTNSDNRPDDFNIGDSRMSFGDGKYGAYYHVHSNTGHEGDTLKWVTTAGAESTGWSWGCSHSMSALLRYNPAITTFMPVCVTDCYPGTSGDFSTNSQGGIYLNHYSGPVIDVNAGCNGSVAGEVGGAALAPDGWKLVFNAHQAPMTPGQNSYDPATMNQDIGFSEIASNYNSTAVVWLTDTPSIDEADATIARWEPEGDATEQYVVGWAEPGFPYVYKLARVDDAGNFIEGPVDISALAGWGRRDDPMRKHFNSDVVWAWFDSPGSTTLNIARLVSGRSYQCASF
jgi:hypothetical protein